MNALTITHDDPIQEIAPHLFEAEASTLGLKPGEWPERINTTMGNTLPLMRGAPYLVAGELIWTIYAQANGCLRLRIIND